VRIQDRSLRVTADWMGFDPVSLVRQGVHDSGTAQRELHLVEGEGFGRLAADRKQIPFSTSVQG